MKNKVNKYKDLSPNIKNIFHKFGFKKIDGYSIPYYCNKDTGLTYSVIRQTKLKEKNVKPNKSGYHTIKLSEGKYKYVGKRVCRIIASSFCDNALNKRIVHHIDCNKANNNYHNLIWLTFKQHRKAHKILNSGDMEAYRCFIEEMQKENSNFKEIN